MKKLLFSLLGCAAALAAIPASAEIVENYTCDFKKGIDKNDPAFAVASSWGHIVDSYTNYAGTEYYQSYTQSAYSGHDGCGKIDIGSQLLNNSKTCNDMLVTPKVSGAVSLWCQSTLYSGGTGSTLTLYAVKKLDDGSYEVGEQYTAQSQSSLPGYNTNTWTEITFDNIAEDAEYPYIGIHGHNARISDFKADKADIERQHKLSVSAIRANGPTTGIVCDEANMATVSLDVTVLNIGDYSYDGTEEGLTISVFKSGDDAALKTFEIGAIAEGASKTVTCELDPMPFSELGTSVVFEAKENYTGSSLASSAVTIREYKPVLNFRASGSYSDMAAGTVVDFGKTNAPVTVALTVNAQKGTAPAEITAVSCPAGFSHDWELPKTIGTTGTTAINLTFDPEALEVGTHSGDIVFTFGGGEAALPVKADVLDPSLIYIPFSDDSEIPGEIVNGSGNAAWRLGYTGSGASRDNYLQPTSSYSAAVLTLPKLTFSDDKTLTIDVRRSGTSAKLEFAYSADRSNWVELPDATLTMNSTPALTYDFQTCEIHGVPAGDYFLRLTGSEVYIDNIYGLPYAAVAHDLGIDDYAIPASGMVNNVYTAAMTVRNYNMAAEEAGSYTAVLVIGDEEYPVESTPEITGAQGTATLTAAFTPHANGEYDAHMELRLADGTVYTTAVTVVTIVPEQIDALHTITPESNSKGSAYVIPFSYDTRLLTEQIFPADYIDLPAGTVINGISFSGYTTLDYNAHIEAWVALSDKTSQDAVGKLPILSLDDCAKVYEGDYSFAKASEKSWFLNLPFTAPVVYDGTSSLVVYLRATTEKTSYSFNFDAYNNGDTSTRYSHYARWKFDDEGNLSGWDNYYLGCAALNLQVETGTVSGRVTEGDAPVSGATITLVSDNVEYYGTSGQDGSYTVEVLQTSRDYAANVTAEGFRAPGAAAVTFGDGMEQTLDLGVLASEAPVFAGVYHTVVLPDVTTAPTGTYYEFTGTDGNKLVFTALSSASLLQPHTPYILRADDDAAIDLADVDFDTATKAVTFGDATLHGTYTSHALLAGEYDPLALITGTAASRSDATMAGPASAYTATSVLNPEVVLVDGTSGIADVDADADAAPGAPVYTVDGRLVRADGSLSGLPAGIYIVNGAKVAIK